MHLDGEYTLILSKDAPNWISTDGINFITADYPNDPLCSVDILSGEFSVKIETPYRNLNNELYSKQIKIDYRLTPWITYDEDIKNKLIDVGFYENTDIIPISFPLNKTYDNLSVNLEVEESDSNYLNLSFNDDKIIGFAKQHTSQPVKSHLTFRHPIYDTLYKYFSFEYNVFPELIINEFISIFGEYNRELTPVNIFDLVEIPGETSKEYHLEIRFITQ